MMACLTTKTVIGSRFSYTTSVWNLKSKSGSAEIVLWLTSITTTVATYVCNFLDAFYYKFLFCAWEALFLYGIVINHDLCVFIWR